MMRIPRRGSLSNVPTEREERVIAGIAAGLTNSEIALQLSRSVKTIEKHRSNLMSKLNLRNAADVTRYALRATQHCITCTCALEHAK